MLLRDRDYVEKMNKLIEVKLELSAHLSVKQRWESLKFSIRNSTVQYTINRKKSNSRKLTVLQRKEKQLEHELETPSPVLHDTFGQLQLVRKDIHEIMRLKTLGAIIRTRKNWAMHGEKPTKYFLNLERHNYNKKTLHRLKLSNGKTITDGNLILQTIRGYYDQLYTAKRKININYPENLEILSISEECRKELDSDVQLYEISRALKELNNNKCGGIDGIPADFYKVFWGKLKGLFLELVHKIVEDGIFHDLARIGILSLLEKIVKDPLFIKNWHPLTLLNVDNKIYTKVMAHRLQRALPSIIHPSQTGFMKGWQLSENIMKLLEIIDKCNEEREDGVIISFDFEKAFDTVQWEAIMESLRLFKFRDTYINMIRVIFNQPMVYVMNNGY